MAMSNSLRVWQSLVPPSVCAACVLVLPVHVHSYTYLQCPVCILASMFSWFLFYFVSLCLLSSVLSFTSLSRFWDYVQLCFSPVVYSLIIPLCFYCLRFSCSSSCPCHHLLPIFIFFCHGTPELYVKCLTDRRALQLCKLWSPSFLI